MIMRFCLDDDSPDGTAEFINCLNKPRVRAVNRRGLQRGLSFAVIDGFKEARGDIAGVMDADLSHPPSAIPLLLKAIHDGHDLAIGSRYVPGGGTKDWPLMRRIASRAACLFALPVTRVKDATSGFFFVKKSALEGVALSGLGFKIGLEVFVKGKHNNNFKEVPYVFSDRTKGESKLNTRVTMCYFKQLITLAGKK
jgi:dolichol-phosphate mannosyltransferase